MEQAPQAVPHLQALLICQHVGYWTDAEGRPTGDPRATLEGIITRRWVRRGTLDLGPLMIYLIIWDIAAPCTLDLEWSKGGAILWKTRLEIPAGPVEEFGVPHHGLPLRGPGRYRLAASVGETLLGFATMTVEMGEYPPTPVAPVRPVR